MKDYDLDICLGYKIDQYLTLVFINEFIVACFSVYSV